MLACHTSFTGSIASRRIKSVTMPRRKQGSRHITVVQRHERCCWVGNPTPINQIWWLKNVKSVLSSVQIILDLTDALKRCLKRNWRSRHLGFGLDFLRYKPYLASYQDGQSSVELNWSVWLKLRSPQLKFSLRRVSITLCSEILVCMSLASSCLFDFLWKSTGKRIKKFYHAGPETKLHGWTYSRPSFLSALLVFKTRISQRLSDV